MAGVLGIYGLIIAVIIANAVVGFAGGILLVVHESYHQLIINWP